jgi:hypothetical protein
MNLEEKAPSPRPSPEEREREKGRQREGHAAQFMGLMRKNLFRRILPSHSKERIRRRISRMDPQNSRAPFYLPLLHTLVEERAGVRRFPSRSVFIGRPQPEGGVRCKSVSDTAH